MTEKLPEHWMRGPVEGIPALVQPVAHALLQAFDEVQAIMMDFPDELLWERPAGVASPAFHLQHLSGVLDRLLTYAQTRSLSEEQLSYLAAEGKRTEITSIALVQNFHQQVQIVLNYLRTIEPGTLTDYRPVGRKKMPSTVMGLLFHAAEHSMRHVGQLLVTVKVVRAIV
jgi:hypothetical protein